MNHHHPISSEVRIQKARTTLLLDHPFFGTLLFRLGGRPSSSIATMATDGVSLFYNPQFVETLNGAELAGVLAHEVMHPALQHHTRGGNRDRARWNMACESRADSPEVPHGLSKPRKLPELTGPNCCAGPGLTRYLPTTSGCVPTGVMSGLGCICRESHRKEWERSRLPLTAPDIGQSSAVGIV